MECIVCSGATARPLVCAPGASLYGRVEGDRQAANTDTRRVIHGVGNSRSDADDSHLAELIISSAASDGAACLLYSGVRRSAHPRSYHCPCSDGRGRHPQLLCQGGNRVWFGQGCAYLNQYIVVVAGDDAVPLRERGRFDAPDSFAFADRPQFFKCPRSHFVTGSRITLFDIKE